MTNAYHYQNSFSDGLAAEFKGILSVGFSPLDLPNLKLWIDAQNEASVTKDGNNIISHVADLSGNNNHAAQPDSARRPIYLPLINSYNGFDNANNSVRHLRLPFALDGNPYTVFVLWNSGASVSNLRAPFGQHDGSTHRFYLATNNNGADILVGLGSGYYPHNLPTPLGINENHILSVTAKGSGNSADVYLDGSFLYSISSYNFTGRSAVECGINSRLTNATNSGAGLRGGVGELIICSGVLPASKIAQTHEYLSSKWGLL